MTRLLRSMLYVPANSWRMITNAAAEGADAVILDLEDGCPMAEKETGRVFARDSIPMLKAHGLDVFVRVNSIETGLAETDISCVVVEGIDGIVLAKTESEDDVLAVDRLLKAEELNKRISPESVTVVALIETPKGIMNVRQISEASRRVTAIAFGAGDFSREMGAGMGVTQLTPEEYFPMVLYARSVMAVVARATGIDAIDTPFFGLVIDLDGLARESEKAKLLGFSGKQLIHPRHVEVINRIFAPTRGDIDLAQKVVESYTEARSRGLGAATIGGKMIDQGSFKRAESLLAFAKAVQEKEDRPKDI